MIRHEVPAALKSEELSRYIKRAWPLLPAYVLRDLLKKKDVRINGEKSARGAIVRGGDLLEIYADKRHFEAQAQVIFNDGRLMAAVKPQGLPSLADRNDVGADTMQLRMQRTAPGAQLCHRLDTATGGVMLAALDEDSRDRAFDVFKNHLMRKRYRAVLCAKPAKPQMELKAWLLKDAKQASVRVSKKSMPGAKEIVTRLWLIGPAGDGLYYADLEPVTGRTHQLRAHMAHIGCPILGDDKYGDREKNKQLGFSGRLCLWCSEMEIFENSPLGEYAGIKFSAEAPDWMKK